jgi:hypothetical protein
MNEIVAVMNLETKQSMAEPERALVSALSAREKKNEGVTSIPRLPDSRIGS